LLKRIDECGKIANVTANHRHVVTGHAANIIGFRRKIEKRHLVAALDQFFSGMRADQSGTGDYNAHCKAERNVSFKVLRPISRPPTHSMNRGRGTLNDLIFLIYKNAEDCRTKSFAPAISADPLD